MDKPRIIFVNRVYWPAQAATAQLLTDLAEALAAHGWPVHVIAEGTAASKHHGVSIHRTGVGEHRSMLERARNYWRFLGGARAILQTLLRPGDIVVVMTDPPMLGAAVTKLARTKGARVVHWIQDIYPEILNAHVGTAVRLLTWPLQQARNRAWHAADYCVTLGADMARTLVANGVPSGKIKSFPNWAPRELHHLATPEAIHARRLAWSLDDKFIVVYSGNLGRVHEFGAIVDAAEQLKTDPHVAFLFIGRGARLEEVRRATQQRRLNNIYFLPPEPREQLAASLGAADAHFVTLKPDFGGLVYPSKLAGVLAVGRPVLFVGPSDGEISRLLTEAGCGFACGSNDGTKLAEAITHGRTASLEEKKRLREAARRTYEKQFTFAAAEAHWVQLFQAITGRSVAMSPGASSNFVTA